MKELISIGKRVFSGEQVNSVDARKLHEKLGSGNDFSTWIRKKVVNNSFFMENKDYILLLQSHEQKGRGGHNRKDYALTLDTAKKVSMAEQTETGNKVRDYFLECEKIAKESVPQLPQNFAEALRLAADLQEEKERLEKQAKEDAPHVEFSKAIEESTGALSLGEFAKVLNNAGIKIGRNRLFAWLRDKDYLMNNKNNEPYQNYVECGYFVMKEGCYKTRNGPRPYVKTLITGRG